MSATAVEDIGDNSAPRAALREQRTANDLQVIAINLSLLAPLRCPPRKLPVFPLAYFSAALACSHDELTGVKNSPKCVRENWQRETVASDTVSKKP
jgi:hypothetical protein